MAYGKSTLTRAQIVRLELESPPERVEGELLAATERLRQVANRCVTSWLVYHDQRQTLLRLRMAADPRQGKLPALNGRLLERVQYLPSACPPELCARLLRDASAVAPDLHSATLLATLNWLTQTIINQTSPRASCKRWLCVLAAEEAAWNFRDPLPIRLWNGNAKIVRAGGVPCVLVRLRRERVAGRRNAISHPEELRALRPKSGNRSAGHRLAYLALCEIADGQRKLRQSQIYRDGRKWFLALTVEQPPQPTAERDPAAVLFIRPGRYDALRIRTGDIRGGFGEEALGRVARERAKIEARHRSHAKQHPGTPLPRTMQRSMTEKWRRQSAAICAELVADVARALEKRQVGKVVWLDGDHRRCALAVAGRDRDDGPELFPFALLRAKAERRLAQMGIAFVGRANLRSAKRRGEEAKKRKLARASSARKAR